MKKNLIRIPVLAAVIGLGLTGLSSSAFAATSCPYQQNYGQNQFQYQYQNNLTQYQSQWSPQYYSNNPSNFNYYNTAQPKQATKKQPAEQPRNSVTENQQQPAQTEKQEQSTNQYANEILNLVNQERAKAGLQPLRLDSNLSKVALDKAKDMANNNYFDHISPTYGSPSDMMKQYGIQPMASGENIAMGQQSPEEVMNQWMNSPGHRKNILNPNYTTIGIGFYKNYWVQEFTG